MSADSSSGGGAPSLGSRAAGPGPGGGSGPPADDSELDVVGTSESPRPMVPSAGLQALGHSGK